MCITAFIAHASTLRPPRLCVGLVKSSRVTLLPIAPCGVGFTSRQRNWFVVASIRHPSAVARSHLARDRIPLEAGYALWGHYNANLLRHLQKFPHVLVRFDIDKDALVQQVARICRLIGLPADTAPIASWYDAALVRSKPAIDDVPVARQIEPLWNELVERQRAQDFWGLGAQRRTAVGAVAQPPNRSTAS